MKPDPKVGMVRLVCWCGASFPVSADASDDTGWPRVREHRAEHKAEKKVKS